MKAFVVCFLFCCCAYAAETDVLQKINIIEIIELTDPVWLRSEAPSGIFMTKGETVDKVEVGEKVAVIKTVGTKTWFQQNNYALILRINENLIDDTKRMGWIYTGSSNGTSTVTDPVMVRTVNPISIQTTTKQAGTQQQFQAILDEIQTSIKTPTCETTPSAMGVFK